MEARYWNGGANAKRCQNSYRYHWAVVDARVNGLEIPSDIDASVVYERHYALNWLVGYSGQEWDDISTDT